MSYLFNFYFILIREHIRTFCDYPERKRHLILREIVECRVRVNWSVWIVLKCILEWIKLALNTVPPRSSCFTRVSNKSSGISWAAEVCVASVERLCSLQFVYYTWTRFMTYIKCIYIKYQLTVFIFPEAQSAVTYLYLFKLWKHN